MAQYAHHRMHTGGFPPRAFPFPSNALSYPPPCTAPSPTTVHCPVHCPLPKHRALPSHSSVHCPLTECHLPKPRVGTPAPATYAAPPRRRALLSADDGGGDGDVHRAPACWSAGWLQRTHRLQPRGTPAFVAQPGAWHVIWVQGDPTVIEQGDDGSKKKKIAARPNPGIVD